MLQIFTDSLLSDISLNLVEHAQSRLRNLRVCSAHQKLAQTLGI